MEAGEVLTIGHSSLPYEQFLSLLRQSEVTAVGDVRSSPHSGHFPQFNRENLSEELKADGITYVYLGNELGGRPSGGSFYCDGVADYEKMAQADAFRRGLDRVIEGARKYRIALMCSERDPLDCHRCLLVGRALAQRGVKVAHIVHDGRTVGQPEMEQSLLKLTGRDTMDLFASPAEQLAAAYRERGLKVGYVVESADSRDPAMAE